MSLLDDRRGLESLQSSYKCYDGIPTPSPIGGRTIHDTGGGEMGGGNGSGSGSGSGSSDRRQLARRRTLSGQPSNNLNRSPSIDSLVESSDPAGSDVDDPAEDDMERMSDSDSIAEIGRITGQIRVDVHRRSDLDDVKNVQPLDGPVIKAFLEKSHEKCEYTNCGYRRRQESGHDLDAEPDIVLAEEVSSAAGHCSRKAIPPASSGMGSHHFNTTSPLSSCPSSPNANPCQAVSSSPSTSTMDTISTSANNPTNSSGTTSNSGTLTSTGSISASLKNRRNSIASSGSVGRMETIIEEPIEPKVSVKEILARFETLREAAEVTETQLALWSIAPPINRRSRTLASKTQSKGSTISSGVRAAAATLNVPLERLETSNVNSPGSPNQISPTEKGHHLHHMAGHPGHLPHHHHQQLLDEFEDMHIDHGMPESSSPMMGGFGNERGHGGIGGGMKHGGNGHQQQQQQHHSPYGERSPGEGPGRVGSGGGGAGSGGMIVNHKNSPMSNGNGNYSDMHIVANHENDSSPTQTSLTKHSLLQFALQHFRTDDEFKSNRSDKRAMRNQHADLVKWQGYPLRAPLLRLPSDLTPLALECFDCVLRYCGDLAVDPELSEVKCVYTVLMHCHKHLALRDEVYCQLMKQTTANRSACPDSAQRAWRLLSILAAYFGCSDALRPYLIEHLTSAASDRRRPCHGTAAVCLTNLRKTARCGGRKNVPSVEEVTAVSAGRSARRQIYRLPGGAERIVNTRCSTVVGDVIAELCSLLGIESPAEQQEFSLYCIVQGDAFTMPLAADEYILDVTTELLKSGQPFYLIFCRSVWHFALKRDPAPTPLYIEVLFNQVAPDYLEGLLLELPNGGAPSPDYVRDMARIAAILHRAADLNHLPAMKEIKFLLPKPALSLRELRPAQWVALVQSAWPSVAGLSPIQVKAQFLNVLSSWPLFGSSFFAVKRVWADENPMEEPSPMWRELILALNRRGVLFLDPNTHETMQHWPFNEVISTRKVRSEDGALFLDMKVGNLLQQRVIRVQTEQAHEISRLVRQYITMAQAQQRDRRE
uniref:MyTH4 domain-containing protein n=1 Tax=Anopheles dirus TaxID=7168 RepID=A0A182NQ59_9DIPT